MGVKSYYVVELVHHSSATAFWMFWTFRPVCHQQVATIACPGWSSWQQRSHASVTCAAHVTQNHILSFRSAYLKEQLGIASHLQKTQRQFRRCIGSCSALSTLHCAFSKLIRSLSVSALLCTSSIACACSPTLHSQRARPTNPNQISIADTALCSKQR